MYVYFPFRGEPSHYIEHIGGSNMCDKPAIIKEDKPSDRQSVPVQMFNSNIQQQLYGITTIKIYQLVIKAITSNNKNMNPNK